MSRLSNWLDFKRNFPTAIPRLSSPMLTPLLNFQQEMDNLMKGFYRALPEANDFQALTIAPSIDLVEDDKIFKVVAEMPGVDEKDIKVSISDNTLIIKAEKEISKKDEKKNYTMREIGYGYYERVIPLPDSVDMDKAKSSFKKGMLWVEIPKREGSATQVRELTVEKAAE